MLGITTLFFLSHWTGLLYVSFLHSVTHFGLQDEGGTYPNIMIICDYCGCSISIIMPGRSYTFSSVQALQVRAFVRIPLLLSRVIVWVQSVVHVYNTLGNGSTICMYLFIQCWCVCVWIEEVRAGGARVLHQARVSVRYVGWFPHLMVYYNYRLISTTHALSHGLL